MPHIEAQSETAAWYALGYEQARDALLFIQYACKAAKGELSWIRGSGGLLNDMAVGVSQSYSRLAGMTAANRRSLFSPPAGIQGHFYDNCEAFAAGADAFRQAVQSATANSPAALWQLHEWLRLNTIGAQASGAWVYTDPITTLDILAQGGWTAAIMSFQWPLRVVNSHGNSYGFQSSGTAPVEPAPESDDPLSPDHVRRLMESMKQQLSQLPGAPSAFTGSNSFAWTGMYCQDPPPSSGHRTKYPGLLGDPHQGIPSWVPIFNVGFDYVPNHLWFAHVKVTPPGAPQPTFDCMGHVPHAAAAFFTGHNRNLAMGGTMGGPNHFDQFLLRLDEDPVTGVPVGNPPAFYSYYAAGSGSNSTYQGLTPSSVTIRKPNNTTLQVPYWEAGRFGVILPTEASVTALYERGTPVAFPVVYGERAGPGVSSQPAWRVGVPMPSDRMRFWSDPQFRGTPPQLVTSPMVVALRQPMNPLVQGEDFHWRLLQDYWEIAHANSVLDVVGSTNGAAYNANVCFVDRQGRTFSTQLSKIPRRGDDTALAAAGYGALDKFAIYSKSFGPVPARHHGDRMFDWQFVSGAVDYLAYSPANVAPPTGPFKPRVWQDPQAGVVSPPTRWIVAATQPNPQVEGALFTSACNDQIWGFSRKRDAWNGSAQNPGFANNALLQWTADRNVLYQTRALGFEAPDRQQIVVDQFTRQAAFIQSGGTHGSPPQTPAEMREFVVTPRLYAEPTYQPPAGVTAVASLPPPIRQLKEVDDNLGFSGTAGESPVVAATRELHFFEDLWAKLHEPGGSWRSHAVAGSSPPVTVDLNALWIRANAPQGDFVFWYDTPQTGQSLGLRWIEMPAAFPLIDFYWPASEVNLAVSGRATTGALASGGVLTSGEASTFRALVNTLVGWNGSGSGYRMEPGSTGACLLEMMRQGYGAVTDPNNSAIDYGRHWMRLRRGSVYDPTPAGSGWTPLTASGNLPGGGPFRRENMPWAALEGVAFPTVLAGGSLFRSAGVKAPYDALYSAVDARVVRTTLQPEHVNALVRFFLQLGGCYIEPTANDKNPSRKLARFQILGGSEAKFVESMPATYPLTDGLIRLTAVRALLDAGNYLNSPAVGNGSIPPFGTCFRTRAYDHTGRVYPPVLPPPPPPAPVPPDMPDVACFGGALRSVVWNMDAEHPDTVVGRGFQPKFLGAGGSIATMLALFPDHASRSMEVDSYYWCTPGVDVMGHGPLRFDAHMNAFSVNVLLESRYDSYRSFVFSSLVHTY
jgi:hypothetical protein